MTFSDGSSTIRHAVNSCVNHKDREGKNLCVHCGNWFCDECMSITHKYLCAICAGAAVEASENAKLENEKRRQRLHGSSMLPLIFAGLMIAFLILLKQGVILVALPIAFFFAATKLFPRARGGFRHKVSSKKRSVFSKTREITTEQFAAVLRLEKGRVTAEKLARLTGVNEKSAKKFLGKEVIEGRLNVEASDTELVYTKFAN
jgi:hypothetical protein